MRTLYLAVFLMGQSTTTTAPTTTPPAKKDESSCHAVCPKADQKAPADPTVVRECAELTTKDECAGYQSDRFPYKCEWGKACASNPS
jgi:hypothetical protein